MADGELYRVKGTKKLRCGYTTGSCAAAAAYAAVRLLLTGEAPERVRIRLPGGDSLELPISQALQKDERASCAVKKDAGDDPDVTNGLDIFVSARLSEIGIEIDGGEGVGRVTAPGLSCPVGTAAINPVPRRMIAESAAAAMENCGYAGGVRLEVSVPGGAEIARRTFNGRLGIEGGISILGTTGIVEPMSEAALVDTIRLLIDRRSASDGEKILICPGNYGQEYCRRELGIDLDRAVKFSNFIGDTLDYLVYKGFRQALLVGHMGKLVKLAGGIMNTHSSVADCRMEILSAHSAMAGAGAENVSRLMACRTTEEAMALIRALGLDGSVRESLMERIRFHVDYRTGGLLQTEIILFENGGIPPVKTPGADELVMALREETN